MKDSTNSTVNESQTSALVSPARPYLQRLMLAARHYPPLRFGVVHPVDKTSQVGAIVAAEQGLITPVLIGPEPKNRAVAETQQIDLTPYALIDTPHSHAAAAQTVALARAGKVEALMEGSLHTDELLRAVITREIGLCTERRSSRLASCALAVMLFHYRREALA